MKKALYLGLDPSNYPHNKPIIHYPIIRIIPTPPENLAEAFTKFSLYSHVIFTSKTAVSLLSKYLAYFRYSLKDLQKKICLSVGKVTTNHLSELGITQIHTAQQETAEGVLHLLSTLSLNNAYFFWPHSAQSRSLIKDYFQDHKFKFRFYSCPLYETHSCLPNVSLNWEEIDEIIFTSPSTVRAFLLFFGEIPLNKQLTAIGPITANALGSCVISPITTK